MLVLSRRVDECIIIGKDIKVMVVSIVRGKVRLGVVAPKNVNILRQEVADAIRDAVPEDDVESPP